MQQENLLKIVKLQEVDSQHVYGSHPQPHALKSLVQQLAPLELLVHYQQEDLLFLLVKVISVLVFLTILLMDACLSHLVVHH